MLIPFDQLFARHNIKPNGALHLGANTGQEAAAYDALGIKQVIWVEALPDIYRQLSKNVARYPGHRAFLACLSDRDWDEVTFRRANNESQSSSFLEFGTHLEEHPGTIFTEEIKMKTTRVDTLIFERQVEIGTGWFLNVDVQGAELKVLRGMGDLLWLFDAAYVEVNTRELYKGCPFVRDIDDFLVKFDLTGAETKMTRHGWGDKLYLRRKKCPL